MVVGTGLSHRLLHACKHRGPSEFGTVVPLPASDMFELYCCVRECFQQCQGGTEWLHPTGAHTCTSSCWFICHRDAYVCCVSGNFHYCTEQGCPYTVESGSSRACPITGNSYPLAFQHTFSEVGFMDAQYRRTTQARVTTKKRRKLDYLAIERPNRKRSHSPPPEEGTPSFVPYEDTVCEVAGYITGFAHLDALSLPERTKLAHIILETWERIGEHAPPTDPSYTLRAHVYTTLYRMAHARESMYDIVFTPFYGDLLPKLLEFRKCMANLDTPLKKHTRWLEIQNKAMSAYCLKEKDAH